MSKPNRLFNFIKKVFAFHDLTSGSPFKVILFFAIPIFISSLLNNSLSLLNSLVLRSTVGGVGVTAINQTGSLSSILFQFAFGASSGFAILASQRKGDNDQEGIKKVFFSSIFLSIILAFVITIVGVFALKPLLRLLNVGDTYFNYSYIYFLVLLIGFVITLINNFFGNFLRALGNSTFPLFVSLGTTLLHIFFVYLLTAPYLLNMNTLGCGIAVIFTNLISLLINYFYIIKKYPSLKGLKGLWQFDKKIYGGLLKFGLPLGLQWSILFIGSFVQNSQVNLFGDDASKAMACYSNFEGYITMPFSALSSAITTFVGQNYGAKLYRRIKLGLRDGLFITLIIYAMILCIALPLTPYVPYIFLNLEEVNDKVIYYTSTYLIIIIVSLILQGTLMLSRSALQGTKHALIPFLAGVGELGARILISLYIPSLIDPSFATNHSQSAYLGLSFSTPSAWLISFLVMGISTLVLIIFNKNYQSDQRTSILPNEKNDHS